MSDSQAQIESYLFENKELGRMLEAARLQLVQERQRFMEATGRAERWEDRYNNLLSTWNDRVKEADERLRRNTELEAINKRLVDAGNYMSEWIRNEIAKESQCLDPADLVDKWDDAKGVTK